MNEREFTERLTTWRKTMKNPMDVAVVLMVSLLLVAGCATQMKPRPSSDVIASVSKNKIAQKANVVISNKDSALEHSVNFGLVGFLFPVTVKVGETLKVYSEEYFGKIFNDVTFSNPPAESIIVVFEIKGFDISAFGKAAHLELKMVINDKSNKQLYEKIYSADGKSHGPFYLSEVTQQRQVQETTQEAFQKVFDEISKDIQTIAFR
jgi:hypothetical protein